VVKERFRVVKKYYIIVNFKINFINCLEVFMKKRICLVACLGIIAILFSFSCQDQGLTNLKNDVNNVATKMIGEFENVASIVEDTNKLIITTLSSDKLDDVDISKMDEKDGGEFSLFQDAMYVRKYDSNSDKINAVIFGATPITDKKKKQLFSLVQKENDIISLFKKSTFASSYGLLSTAVSDVVFTYPQMDMASAFPPKLSFDGFPWFKEVLDDGTGNAIPISPVVSIGPIGWIQSLCAAVKVDNSDIGIIFMDLAILKLCDEMLNDAKGMVLIAYKDTNVFGASDLMKSTLSIKVMGDFDYVDQLKANPKYSDEFKLSNEKQDPEVMKLASYIKSENVGSEDLTVTIKNKTYKVFVNEIKGYNYFVVGLK
jgi:hypothetical protein